MMSVRINRLALRVSTLIACALAGEVNASVVYVRADAATGGDGSSWASAFTDLQDALALPAATEVWIAEGTYRPDRETAIRSMAFNVDAGVALLGGFAGWESSPAQRMPGLHPTILSGDLLGNDLPGFLNVADNSFHVVAVIDSGPPVLLDGLTVRGGNANGFSFYKRGGGIFSFGGSITLVDCTVEECLASWGGGIAVNGGSVSLTGSSVRSCHADKGGGIHAALSPVTVQESVVTANGASTDGGGLWIDGALLLFLDSTLDANSAKAGGGVWANGCDAMFMSSDLLANAASDQGGIDRDVGWCQSFVLHHEHFKTTVLKPSCIRANTFMQRLREPAEVVLALLRAEVVVEVHDLPARSRAA